MQLNNLHSSSLDGVLSNHLEEDEERVPPRNSKYVKSKLKTKKKKKNGMPIKAQQNTPPLATTDNAFRITASPKASFFARAATA